MGYLFATDFVLDCFASASATNLYSHDRALQNWVINRDMHCILTTVHTWASGDYV